MALISDLRSLWQPETQASSRTVAALRGQTEAFCAATTLVSQTGCLIELFSGIWLQGSERAFQSRLVGWIGMLEQDHDLRVPLSTGMKSMLGSLDSVSFFAEAGIPAQHALFREITSRLFQRWLPPPRAETTPPDSSPRSFVRRAPFSAFWIWMPRYLRAWRRISGARKASLPIPTYTMTSHEALRLMAARVSARGTSRAVRQRTDDPVGGAISPYALVFATEQFIACEHSAARG